MENVLQIIKMFFILRKKLNENHLLEPLFFKSLCQFCRQMLRDAQHAQFSSF